MAITTINNIEFSYTSGPSRTITAFGFTFEREIPYNDEEKPLKYWKAQLGFRGYSPRGSNIEALKQRLREADVSEIDPVVRKGLADFWRQIAVPETSTTTTRRRRASISLGDVRRSAPSSVPSRPSPPPPPPPPPPPLAVQPRGPFQFQRSGPVVDIRLAIENPLRFLRLRFIDETGQDKDADPVELKDIDRDQSLCLQMVANFLQLFNRIAKTAAGESILVVGSGKNSLGQERFDELNHVGPQILYRPCARAGRVVGRASDGNRQSQVSGQGKYDEQSQLSESRREGVEETTANSHGNEQPPSSESEKEDEQETTEEGDGAWKIDGTWEIECDALASRFGQHEPWTLEISTFRDRHGKQICGRFSFGNYHGVLRFCQYTNKLGTRESTSYQAKREFQIEEAREPSLDDPLWCYRWRGRERTSHTIQLDQDKHVHWMLFADHGTAVLGTWGCSEEEVGDVEFSGRKISDASGVEGGVAYEWGHLDKRAYDEECRARFSP